jgi:hypothetical protein
METEGVASEDEQPARTTLWTRRCARGATDTLTTLSSPGRQAAPRAYQPRDRGRVAVELLLSLKDRSRHRAGCSAATRPDLLCERAHRFDCAGGRPLDQIGMMLAVRDVEVSVVRGVELRLHGAWSMYGTFAQDECISAAGIHGASA